MVEYRCVNCDILFDWQPTVVRGRLFCCTGCAQGGPCSCDYENLPRAPVAREQPNAAHGGEPGSLVHHATKRSFRSTDRLRVERRNGA